MKQIPLTKCKFALVDDEDYDYLMQWKWRFSGKYAVRSEHKTRKTIFMHRVVNNTPNGLQADHINNDKLDNRKENIRFATSGQNSRNKPKNRGVSKYKGVFKVGGGKDKCWKTAVVSNGKRIWSKCFYTEEEAALVYNQLALKHYGEFAYLNIIGINNDGSAG